MVHEETHLSGCSVKSSGALEQDALRFELGLREPHFSAATPLRASSTHRQSICDALPRFFCPGFWESKVCISDQGCSGSRVPALSAASSLVTDGGMSDATRRARQPTSLPGSLTSKSHQR